MAAVGGVEDDQLGGNSVSRLLDLLLPGDGRLLFLDLAILRHRFELEVRDRLLLGLLRLHGIGVVELLVVVVGVSEHRNRGVLGDHLG